MDSRKSKGQHLFAVPSTPEGCRPEVIDRLRKQLATPPKKPQIVTEDFQESEQNPVEVRMTGLERTLDRMTTAVEYALERERSPGQSNERIQELEAEINKLKLERVNPEPATETKKPTIGEMLVQGFVLGVGGYCAYRAMDAFVGYLSDSSDSKGRAALPPVENHFYETTATLDGESLPVVIEGITKHMDSNLDKYRGPQGEAGQPGQDGAQGPRGFQGMPGAPGRDGRAGRRGARGARGSDGANGRNGRHGRNGRNGRDGRDGRDGANSVNVQRRQSRIKGDWL